MSYNLLNISYNLCSFLVSEKKIMKNENIANENDFNQGDYAEIMCAVNDINCYLEVLADYCEHNIENTKIYPLVKIIEQLQKEGQNIISKM